MGEPFDELGHLALEKPRILTGDQYPNTELPCFGDEVVIVGIDRLDHLEARMGIMAQRLRHALGEFTATRQQHGNLGDAELHQDETHEVTERLGQRRGGKA